MKQLKLLALCLFAVSNTAFAQLEPLVVDVPGVKAADILNAANSTLRNPNRHTSTDTIVTKARYFGDPGNGLFFKVLIDYMTDVVIEVKEEKFRVTLKNTYEAESRMACSSFNDTEFGKKARAHCEKNERDFQLKLAEQIKSAIASRSSW